MGTSKQLIFSTRCPITLRLSYIVGPEKKKSDRTHRVGRLSRKRRASLFQKPRPIDFGNNRSVSAL